MPTKKYESEGGPGVRRIAELLRVHSSARDDDVATMPDSSKLAVELRLDPARVRDRVRELAAAIPDAAATVRRRARIAAATPGRRAPAGPARQARHGVRRPAFVEPTVTGELARLRLSRLVSAIPA